MGIWDILIIAVGLSLDVFAYCLYRGAMVSELKRADVAKTCAIFTAFETAALFVGSCITLIPAVRDSYARAKHVWVIVAAVAFFALGAYMLVRAFMKRHRRIEEKKEDRFSAKVIVVWALITAFDALIAGIGFGILNIWLLVSLVAIAAVTALSVIVGLLSGYRLGCGPMNKFVVIGGCLVLIGGFDVLMHYVLF